VELVDGAGQSAPAFNISEGARVDIEYEILQDGGRLSSPSCFRCGRLLCIGSLSNVEPSFYGKPMPKASIAAHSSVRSSPECGSFSCLYHRGSAYWSDAFRIEYVISFDAIDDGVLKGDYAGSYDGAVRPKLKWETLPLRHQLEGLHQDKEILLPNEQALLRAARPLE